MTSKLKFPDYPELVKKQGSRSEHVTSLVQAIKNEERLASILFQGSCMDVKMLQYGD